MRVSRPPATPGAAEPLLAGLRRAWHDFAAFNAAHIESTERQLRINTPRDDEELHWIRGHPTPRLRGSYLPPPASRPR